MKKNSKKIVYMDNASSTPIERSVFLEMKKFMTDEFGNPGSLHQKGVMAKNALDDARKKVADILSAMPDEIIFTSSGTESNNLAIQGVMNQANQTGQGVSLTRVLHIVTTNIEHSSVLETCRYLEKEGKASVTYVPVESNGVVDPEKIKEALKENTVLVSVMYANNEIGTIQPIMEIAKEIRFFRKQRKPKSDLGTSFKSGLGLPIFHTDATQAINYLPIKVEKLGVDLMSFNGSKIYGPKGVGVLFTKHYGSTLIKDRSTRIINPIMYGGEQEFGLRPGTENVVAIVGFAKALEITEKIKNNETKRLTKLRDYFIKKLKKQFPQITINGDLTNRLPNNINISVPNFESELLVIELDARGVAASSKSACKTKSKEFYVIKAIRPDFDYKKGAIIRFSLGRQNIKNDVEYAIKSLSEIFKKYKKFML